MRVGGASLLLLLLQAAIAAEKLRFTGWHDKLADRKKIYEDDTQMLMVQATREIATRAIARHLKTRQQHNVSV